MNMGNKKGWRRFAGVTAGVAAVALALTGCAADSGGDAGGDAGQGGGELSVALVPKILGHPYFDVSAVGAEEAANELGAEFQEVGPTEGTPDAQVSYINTLTQQGVSAILLSANDPNATGSALNEARDNGIAVITWDSDTDPQYRDLFVNQASAEGIAKGMVDAMAADIDNAGNIAILSAAPNATNQNAWIAIMEEYIASDYPDITIVDTVYGDDDDQTSFDKTAALLQSHPDLDGIISPTTAGLAAAARYLSTSDAKGKVALTGLGTPNQMREYIKDETLNAFVLWNPSDLAYLTVFAAKAWVDGAITGAEGETFDGGRLGEYTIGADATVLLGDPLVFNADNIDDFDF